MKKGVFSILGSIMLLIIILYFLIAMNNPKENSQQNIAQNMEKNNNETTVLNVGDTGYAVISPSLEYELERRSDFYDTSLWVIPTYAPDKQFWNETDVTIQHKTPITILEKYVKHNGYGVYSGYLFVEEVETGDQYYIDAINFGKDAYWEYTDLYKAALKGPYVAVFNQISGYYPMDYQENKKTITNNTYVLVTLPAGSLKLVDNDDEWVRGTIFDTHPIHSVYFNVNDLTIVY